MSGNFKYPVGGAGGNQGGNAKKKRRTSQNTAVSVNPGQPPPGDMNMMNDTVFANNPFDDGPGGMNPMGGGGGMMDPRRGPMMGPNGPMMNGHMMPGPDGMMGPMGPGEKHITSLSHPSQLFYLNTIQFIHHSTVFFYLKQRATFRKLQKSLTTSSKTYVLSLI